MENNAQTIADILIATDIEDRGDLLKMVSDILKDNSQGFTAKVVFEAAYTYGIKHI